MQYIKFYISIGAETFSKLESILVDGAERFGLEVEFSPQGYQILDLGVKLTGNLDQAPSYVEWFLDIVDLYKGDKK